MPAFAKRNSENRIVFYLIMAAALIYNLFLIFDSKEKITSNTPTKNELTASTLNE